MLAALERRASQAVARALRGAALGLAGAVLLGCGTAFLTVAAWLLIARLADAMTAALVIGLVYCGAGLICLALASARPGTARVAAPPAPPAPPPPPQQVGWAAILEAFFTGLQAGLRKDRMPAPPPPPQQPPQQPPPPHRQP